MTSDVEHDYYTTITGSFLILFGVLGVFLNTSTLGFYWKMDARDQPGRKKIKIVAGFMSLVDLLFAVGALGIRGPGFIWPQAIYGDDTTVEEGSTTCKALSITSAWFLSDLNMLAIVPITCLAVFGLSKRGLWLVISFVVFLPVLETVLLIIGVEEGYLDSRYTDTYRRCSFHQPEGQSPLWLNLVDYFNMVVFNILPLVFHLVSWIYKCVKVCRVAPDADQKRRALQSGALVVVVATVTWLPYGISYGILGNPPQGPLSLVYIFFYLSIVTNPLLYGFWMYRCGVFREGCSECCCPDSEEQGQGEPQLQQGGVGGVTTSSRPLSSEGAMVTTTTSSPMGGLDDNVTGMSSI